MKRKKSLRWFTFALSTDIKDVKTLEWLKLKVLNWVYLEEVEFKRSKKSLILLETSREVQLNLNLIPH